MKTINKKIIFGLSLIFLLCLSIGSISAEELNDGSLVLSDNSDSSEIMQATVSDENIDLTESNEGMEQLEIVDDNSDISTNDDL